MHDCKEKQIYTHVISGNLLPICLPVLITMKYQSSLFQNRIFNFDCLTRNRCLIRHLTLFLNCLLETSMEKYASKFMFAFSLAKFLEHVYMPEVCAYVTKLGVDQGF